MLAAFTSPIVLQTNCPRIARCNSGRRIGLRAMSSVRAVSAPPGEKTIEKQAVRTPIDGNSSVLVIGASRGIGLEFVSQCLERGARVYATARGEPKSIPPGLASLSGKHADNLKLIHMDVTGPLDALNTIPLSDVTHVIHNAGIYGARSALPNVSMDEMLRVFSINAAGVLRVAQAVTPSLRAHGDRLPVYGVLTSKVGSIDDNGSGGGYAYRASKSACNIIVKSLSIDLAGQVSFVLLHPGYVRTDMTGGRGLIDCDESVCGMLKAIEATGPEVGFRWVDYKAELIPW